MSEEMTRDLTKEEILNALYLVYDKHYGLRYCVLHNLRKIVEQHFENEEYDIGKYGVEQSEARQPNADEVDEELAEVLKIAEQMAMAIVDEPGSDWTGEDLQRIRRVKLLTQKPRVVTREALSNVLIDTIHEYLRKEEYPDAVKVGIEGLKELGLEGE